MSVELGTETTTIQDAAGGNTLIISAGGAAKVDGSAITQPISATSLPLPTGASTSANQSTIITSLSSIDAGIPATLGQTTMATSLPITIASDQSAVSVSLGNTTNKTNVLQTGTLTTTATTANQVILTYTVTSGTTFYLQYMNLTVGLTSAPTNYNTPVIFGTTSIETPSNTKILTWRFMGPQPQQNNWIVAESVPITAGTVVRVVCTPGITTSLQWIANFGGYEK